MDRPSQSTFPSTFEIQTLRPRLRLHGPVVLLGMCGGFFLLFFLTHGIYRAYSCGVCILAVGAVLYQYRKEYALVRDHQSAVAVVMEHKTHKRAAPTIKYSFVAFNGQTYTGRAGWNAHSLRVGTQVPVLYRAGNPSTNLPFPSFIFYSFH
jgi:hypothetical protein